MLMIPFLSALSVISPKGNETPSEAETCLTTLAFPAFS